MAVALQPKGELIATGSSDAKLRLIDAATGDVEREISHRDAFLRHSDLVAFTPHGDVDLLAACRDKGSGPLHIAANNGHEAIVSSLLEAGEDKNAKTPDGITPLFVAALEGHKEVVSALLAAGADKNAKTPDGATPLFFAALEGHKEVVSALLAAGAHENAAKQGFAGAMPLYAAAQKGHEGVVSAPKLDLTPS